MIHSTQAKYILLLRGDLSADDSNNNIINIDMRHGQSASIDLSKLGTTDMSGVSCILPIHSHAVLSSQVHCTSAANALGGEVLLYVEPIDPVDASCSVTIGGQTLYLHNSEALHSLDDCKREIKERVEFNHLTEECVIVGYPSLILPDDLYDCELSCYQAAANLATFTPYVHGAKGQCIISFNDQEALISEHACHEFGNIHATYTHGDTLGVEFHCHYHSSEFETTYNYSGFDVHFVNNCSDTHKSYLIFTPQQGCEDTLKLGNDCGSFIITDVHNQSGDFYLKPICNEGHIDTVLDNVIIFS